MELARLLTDGAGSLAVEGRILENRYMASWKPDWDIQINAVSTCPVNFIIVRFGRLRLV